MNDFHHTPAVHRFNPYVPFVIPAKAGIQRFQWAFWMPAFAGMTMRGGFLGQQTFAQRRIVEAFDKPSERLTTVLRMPGNERGRSDACLDNLFND